MATEHLFRKGDLVLWYQVRTLGHEITHAHAGIELHFCEEGEGYFLTRGVLRPMVPGRITLIYAPVVHAVRANPRKTYYRTVLHVPQEYIAKASAFLDVAHLPFLPSPAQSVTQCAPRAREYVDLRSAFHRLYRELKHSQECFCNPAIQLYVAEILHILVRAHSAHEASKSDEQSIIRDDIVGRALRLIDEDPASHLTTEHIADRLGVNRSHLWRVFQLSLGMSPKDYLFEHKMRVAKQQLLSGIPVAEVAKKCGYTTTSSFSRAFKRYTGLSPSAYVKDQ